MSGWQTRAACKDAYPETFYPAGDSYPEWAVDEAKKWCGPCPVRDQCLEAHLGEIHGIFAETTPADREVIRRRRARRKPVAGVVADRRALNPPKFAKSERCPEPGRHRSVARHVSLKERLCLPCAVFDADQIRTAELDQRVLTLAGEGRNPSAIARELDLHRDVVAGIVRKYRKREIRREVAA